MASIAELLALRSRLQAVGDNTARDAALDIELLLCHCLQQSRSYLRAWPELQVTDEVEARFNALLSRREQGEPVAYLTGERGFWSLDLIVSPATLIPRPETELLVEKSLDLLADKTKAHILDLGTGTGAIALALACERPQYKIVACDVEPEAVALAESNRRKNSLANVRILQSDWFSAVAEQRFDLIVSNPPYIDPEDPHLKQGDVRFEPRSALVADNHGLADIEKIISQASPFLYDNAWLLFEHGYNQGVAVRELLMQAGFEQVFTEQDLAGLDRISGGRLSCGNAGVNRP